MTSPADIEERGDDHISDHLDNLLTWVHEELEGGASADRIKSIAEANPFFEKEIMAFAAEWFAQDGSGLGDNEP